MTRTLFVHHVAIMLCVLALSACADSGAEADMEATTNNTTPDDTDPEDMGCMPQACTELGDVCGMQDDGCGAVIDCGACSCDPADPVGSCPSAPCQVATGCVEAGGECTYGPVVCAGLSCTCPEGADCSAMPARCGLDGGNVCPAIACDPAPMTVDGKTVFGNMCVPSVGRSCDPPEGVCALASCEGSSCAIDSCGTCGLGGFECAADQAAACVDAPLAGILDEATAECDDTSLSSTFLFVDANVGVDEGDSGSRTKPFRSIRAAYNALDTRSAKAIVVAGSPTFSDVPSWERAVSILGGYVNIGGSFERDLSQRPTFASVASSEANADTFGMIVRNVGNTPTVFHHIAIQAEHALGANTSSHGMLIADAPAFVLDDVEVTAGDGAAGINGADGGDGRSGKNGGRAATGNSLGNGAGGTNSSCAGANGGAGGVGGNGNDLGQNGANSAGGTPGGAGGASGQPGKNGANGLRLFPGLLVGAGAQAQGAVDAKRERWVFTDPAKDGADGFDGNGAGGGGGAGGLQITVPFGNPIRQRGGAAGGGGAGGCGGERGRAGTSGGASIGVMAIRSNGLTVRNSIITTGDGGNGGSGGSGGAGGAGGKGGNGAPGQFPTLGGRGGNGQGGQSGTRGGGGAGGPSLGLACDGPTRATIDTTTTVKTGSGGAGGQSGGSTERGASGEVAENQNCD
ncbi:MAG: hypothetical protein AAGI01_04910 [Myxococcota bacterium]